ncbi:MAG: HTH-type transcriptional regulator LutR [candidate division BRC1 bacterium ADurb.BinA364]|nr:MAG: HTH-type transcriptional regulator LutR [candidate division BRC1 bacterium ADurb.BinA364]
MRRMESAPVETTCLADAVEQRILNALRGAKLKPGDALPGELHLARDLGISRSMVREGLSRLRMLGLLSSRKRRGMTLAHPDLFLGLERVMDPAFLDAETVRDLMEIRLALEMGLADFLFARKTPDDLSALERIAAEELGAATDEARLEAEIAFHAKLYAMAGNRALARFQALLRPFFQSLASMPDRPRGTARHTDLIETLRSGGPEDFRKAMRLHLAPHFDRALERHRASAAQPAEQ